MAKKIVWKKDGRVDVFTMSPEHIAKFKTESEALEAAKLRVVPAGATGVEFVNEVDVPTDRTFRNAWKKNVGSPFTVGMAKARVIHEDHINRRRIEVAQTLDQREMLHGENLAQEKAAVRSQQFKLDIEAAMTPAELKSVWPDILGPQT